MKWEEELEKIKEGWMYYYLGSDIEDVKFVDYVGRLPNDLLIGVEEPIDGIEALNEDQVEELRQEVKRFSEVGGTK